jgi:hypothetical protein
VNCRGHLWTLLALPLLACDGAILAPEEVTGSATGTRVGAGGADGGSAPACTSAVASAAAPGHYLLRRLTNDEYTHTVQDLMFTSQQAGANLAQSVVGASGYGNDSRTLTVYSGLVLGYYDAATAVVKEVIASKGQADGAYAKLVTCDTTQPACATATVTRLAKRALRRPPTAADLDATTGLMGVFNASGDFDQGLSDVALSLLMHPEFLMIPVVDARSLDPSAVFALDDYELASRLSYFIWQSMPDDALTAAADLGTLHTAPVLKAQVKRMLADPRAAHLKNTLRDQYAELSTFAAKDLTLVGQTNTLRDAMIGETDAFLNDLIANDRSASTLLTSDQSFVNKTLADFYGLTFPDGADPASFVAVTSGRMGLGSHASVLTNTGGGGPVSTNPIKRGHWIAKKLFCDEPPPPPPGIPPLPAAGDGGTRIRERIAAHVSQPSCMACHKDMDNFGLGAESYGPFGQWRTQYADGSAVDSSGQLPDGTTFMDSKQMYTELAAQPAARACVAQQLMQLGLSRALGSADERCVASNLGGVSVTPGARFSDLMAGVVLSNPFLMQTGEAP